MKKIISVILTMLIALPRLTPVFADDKITADEVKELIEKTTLLSRQDYCNEVLEAEVYDREDILSGKKRLRELIDPEKALIFVVSCYDNGGIKEARIEAWDDEGRIRTVYLNKNYRDDNPEEYIRSYISEYNYDADPAITYYLNAGKTAKIINDADISDITGITFDAIAGIEIFAGTEIYVLDNDKCVTLDSYFKNNIFTADKETELYEKKRSLTPPEMLRRFDEYLEFYDEAVNNYIYGKRSKLSLTQYYGTEDVFSDLNNDDFLKQAAALLKDKGIISGFEDGTFRPESILTRAEAAVILQKLVRGDYENGKTLPDMQYHWASGAVNYLTAANVIHGYDDGLFHPDNTLTYEHAANLLYAVMGYYAEDVDTGIRDKEFDHMYKMMQSGLFDGMESFTNDAGVTRGDFVKMIANAFDMFMYAIYAPIDGKKEPSYYGEGLEVTLSQYLDGKEIIYGEIRVSKEGYEEWIKEYTDWYYKTYESIL